MVSKFFYKDNGERFLWFNISNHLEMGWSIAQKTIDSAGSSLFEWKLMILKGNLAIISFSAGIMYWALIWGTVHTTSNGVTSSTNIFVTIFLAKPIILSGFPVDFSRFPMLWNQSTELRWRVTRDFTEILSQQAFVRLTGFAIDKINQCFANKLISLCGFSQHIRQKSDLMA